jgi:hypothetical protein
MSGPSASGSMVPAAFGSMVPAASAPAAVSALEKPVHFPAGSIRDLIVTALGISEHLISRKKGGDVRVAYAKYLALVDALDKLSLMSASGTWKHTNTNDDVVEVFVSKSVYFKSHAKIFPLLDFYPAMKEWLEKVEADIEDRTEADIAAADAVVWGSEKHTLEGLRRILTTREKASAVKGKGKGKGKEKEKERGKGKGKEVNRDGSSSPPVPVEKKTTNKKDKRKEEIHNKKASSSKGRHGHN